MTKEEVLLLVKAGYTKEEITQMGATKTPSESEKKDANTRESAGSDEKGEKEDTTKKDTKEDKGPDKRDSDVEQLKESLTELRKAIQGINISSSTASKAETESVDDIMMDMLK